MNKKLKIFIKILYYIFTFGLGVLLAIMLPATMIYDVLASDMDNHLANGEYDKAMELIGGYYDSEYSYLEKFDDSSGVVLFEAMTIEQEDTKSKAVLCYAGFVFGVKDTYNVVSENGTNKTALLVNEGLSNEQKINLLNFDSDKDGIFDGINTLVNCSYVYFEVPLGSVSEINSLSFVDASNSVFKKVTLSLNFDKPFFESLKDFKAEFDRDNASAELQSLEDKFFTVNQNYKKGSYGDAYTRVNQKTLWIVIVYFVCIYIIADFLVGQRLIIALVSFIIRKIRKNKVKTEDSNSVYGTDYYTKVLFKLNVPEDFESDIMLSYSNNSDTIEVVLKKASNYEEAKRVHAGKYMNFRLESNEYEAIDAPEVLDVNGFRMDVTINLVKKVIMKDDDLQKDKEV